MKKKCFYFANWKAQEAFEDSSFIVTNPNKTPVGKFIILSNAKSNLSYNFIPNEKMAFTSYDLFDIHNLLRIVEADI